MDYIVDLSGHEAIFGAPTIQITNGIDLDLYQPKKPVDDLNIVNVVSVAFFEQWHGIDRFIKGLHDYLQEGNERLVHVHLVGGGSALPSLERLVVDLGLQKYVTFYGVLQGEELSAVYDRCSLAIECLGIHRKGRGQRSASLKSREYLARGIPFFGSSEIDVFAKHPMRYFFKEPEDESNIDIEELIQFHDALYENHGQEAIIAEMREYAERYISMDSAMKNVTGFLTES